MSMALWFGNLLITQRTVWYQLIPSVSSTDWTAQKGLFSFQVTYVGLAAYVGTNPPQVYYQNDSIYSYTNKKGKYIRFLNGSLSFFFSSDEQGDLDDSFASSAQYMKFMPDGHLKVFELKEGWSEVADLLTDEPYGECNYPLACGRNAICSNKQHCSCPSSSPDYFRAVNDRQPNLGCSAITPLTCNDSQDHFFISLQNVSISRYPPPPPPEMGDVSMETCKQACLNNCSCKAAVFMPVSDSSYGRCSLPSELFTTISVDQDDFRMNASIFIKVQNVISTPVPKKKSRPIAVFITSIFVSSSVLLVLVGFIAFLNRKLRSDAQMEEEYINAVPGSGEG
ncbi:putative non-specific serine/threonine protein kinase [Helianthus debilis subsp. tardiflorus]